MSSLSQAVRLLPEALRTLNFSGISTVYSPVGTSFNNACRLLYIVNNTNAILWFSLDGVTDHFVVPVTSSIIIDVTANRTDIGGALSIAMGTRVFVRGEPDTGGAPSSGDVFVSVFYAKAS